MVFLSMERIAVGGGFRDAMEGSKKEKAKGKHATCREEVGRTPQLALKGYLRSQMTGSRW